MSRIVIADLPEIQDLNETELQEIYGAGRPVRRKSRESFPGIVHLEVLERREVFSATGLQAVASASTAEGVAAEMQGSKVEKDTAGNTVFTQSEKGSVIRKAVFSPTGQLVSYERVQGDLWVSASYQNGKLSTVTSSKAGVLVVRQEFAADGSVTKETQFDSKGKKALETTITGTIRQVTVYLDGNTARVQTWKLNATLKKDVLTYEEIWSAGKRIGQTQNTDSGELQSKWMMSGNQKIKTVVTAGLTDETVYEIRTQKLPRENRTFVTEILVRHEQTSPLKGLLLREAWDSSGKLVKTEKWLRDKAGVLNTVTSFSGSTTVEESTLNGIRVKLVTRTEGFERVESWNAAGDQTRVLETKGIHADLYEYTTENVPSGKSTVRKTYLSKQTLTEKGNLIRADWFDHSGQTQRKLFKQVAGKPKPYLMIQYKGVVRIETTYRDGGEVVATTYKKSNVVWHEVTQKGVVTSTLECYDDGTRKELNQYAGKNVVTFKYDRSGKLLSRTLSVDGKKMVIADYVPATGKPLLVTILDKNGKRTHEDSWEYQGGNVLRRSRDFNPGGLQEIQRREWLNQRPKAYYVWTHVERGNTTEQVWLVQKQWEAVIKNGKSYNFLVRDSVNLPDWTVLKDYRWLVNTLTEVPGAFPQKWFLAEGAPKELRNSDDTMAYSDPGGLFLGPVRFPSAPPEITLPKNPEDGLVMILDPLTGGQGQELVDGAKAIIPDLSEKLSQIEISIEWAQIRTLELPKLVQKFTSIFDALPSPSQLIKKIQGIDLPELKTALDRIQSIGSTIERGRANAEKAGNDAKKVVESTLTTAKKTIDNAKKEAANTYKKLKDKADTTITAGNKGWDDAKSAAKKVGNAAKGAWQEMQDWLKANDPTVRDGAGYDASIYRISVQQLGNKQYRIKAEVSHSDARAIRFIVTRDGQEVSHQYIASGSDVRKEKGRTRLQDVDAYEAEFTAELNGLYTVEVAAKDFGNRWFEVESGKVELPLPTADSKEIFYDEINDPYSKKNIEGNESVGPVVSGEKTYKPSNAENRRGFELPYLVEGIGIVVTEKGDLYFDLELTEVTDQTKITVYFTSVDSRGEPLNMRGETRKKFDERIEAEFERQQSMVAIWNEFESWFNNHASVRDAGESLLSRFHEANANRPPADAYSTVDDYIYYELSLEFTRYLADAHYDIYNQSDDSANRFFQNAYVALSTFPKLGDEVWDEYSISQRMSGLEIQDGVPIPSLVTKSDEEHWQATMVVQEEDGSKPWEISSEKLAPGGLINKSMKESVLKAGQSDWRARANKYKAWYQTYEDHKRTERDQRIGAMLRSRESLLETKALCKEAANDSATILETFGGFIPVFGTFQSAGNTYFYAKDGQYGSAAAEGAAVILDVLSLGLGRVAGKLVHAAAAARTTKSERLVVKAEESLLGGSADALKKVSQRGIRIRAIAGDLKAVGMDPMHASRIGTFAQEKQMLLITRASNVNSMKFQGKAGYLAKPSTLSLKTGPDGLVIASKQADGTLVDAANRVTDLFVGKDDRIFRSTVGNIMEETPYFLKKGYVVDAKGNKFFSDYDLLGAYELQGGSTSVWQPVATNGDKGALSPFVNALNEYVDPKSRMFQHGANDEYWKALKSEVRLGNKDIGDTFTVAWPDGTVKVMGLKDIETLYRDMGIKWPLSN